MADLFRMLDYGTPRRIERPRGGLKMRGKKRKDSARLRLLCQPRSETFLFALLVMRMVRTRLQAQRKILQK